MASGTVKWFNPTKGFGFIQPDSGGKDVFVHISAVERAGLNGLNEGQKITYEIESQRGKEAAVNLKVLRLRVYGPLTLQAESHQAEWHGRAVGLTLGEFKVVDLLASTAGEVCSYRAIYDRMHYAGFIAGSGDGGFRTNIRSMMKKIRRKFLAMDPRSIRALPHAAARAGSRG